MLMFDRISEIAEAGGEYGKGLARAVLNVRPDLWFFPCHFKGDPVSWLVSAWTPCGRWLDSSRLVRLFRPRPCHRHGRDQWPARCCRPLKELIYGSTSKRDAVQTGVGSRTAGSRQTARSSMRE